MFSKKTKASILAYLLFNSDPNAANCNGVENDLPSTLNVSVSGISSIPPLPEGSHPWSAIRKLHMVYVDKTIYMKYFAQQLGFLCYLTRPRRFGKTTFIDALADFFRGYKNGTEFKGTNIFKFGNTIDLNGEWVEHPVIKIDMSAIRTSKSFWDQMYDVLANEARKYPKVTHYNRGMNIDLLIEELHNAYEQPVVVLIDEYDTLLNRQIYSNKNDADELEKVKQNLNSLFSQIKSSSDFIKVAMLMGVNRYSLSGLFSGSNCFKDISHEQRLSNAFGFTKEEILYNFRPHINNFAIEKNKTFDQIVAELEEWYDGYVFSTEDTTVKIFNPISVIQSLSNHAFEMYWSSTGSVRSVITTIYNLGLHLKDMLEAKIRKKDINKKFDPNFNSIPIDYLMFNTGYLTISKITTAEIEINSPNTEVREYLSDHYYSYIPSENAFLIELTELTKALTHNMIHFKVHGIVENLNKICFIRELKNALTAPPLEYEVNRRLAAALDMCNIAYDNPQINEPIQNRSKKQTGVKTSGDLDIVTTGLKTNYVIELKRGALQDGIEQIMRYFKCHHETLNRYTGNTTEMYLLVLDIEKSKNGKFADWVAIPCKDEKMDIDHAVTSSDRVKTITQKCFDNNQQLRCKNLLKSRNQGITDACAYPDTA